MSNCSRNGSRVKECAHRIRTAVCGVVVVLAADACGSSGNRFSVCGVTSSITAPMPVLARAPEPRFHSIITRDSVWPTRLTAEVATMSADTSVRVLLIHDTDVIESDREYVTARQGSIVDEPADWNGIVAVFTVRALRAFAPTTPTTRIIDAHVVSERILPPCN